MKTDKLRQVAVANRLSNLLKALNAKCVEDLSAKDWKKAVLECDRVISDAEYMTSLAKDKDKLEWVQVLMQAVYYQETVLTA